LAESEGFEPPDLLQSTVFKTAAIDHSANSPRAKLKHFIILEKYFFELERLFLYTLIVR
jgi:hypothetical protein